MPKNKHNKNNALKFHINPDVKKSDTKTCLVQLST
jgi:hypothetical protein